MHYGVRENGEVRNSPYVYVEFENRRPLKASAKHRMKSLKSVIQLSLCLEIKSCIKKFIITCYDYTSFYNSMFCLNKGSVRGGGGGSEKCK